MQRTEIFFIVMRTDLFIFDVIWYYRYLAYILVILYSTLTKIHIKSVTKSAYKIW